MESYAQVLQYAIPFFMVLIGIEWMIGMSRGIATNRSFDTISSLSSGMTNTIKEVLGLTIIIVSYGWMVDHFSFFSIEASWLLYVLTFIGLDFAGYWSHRFNHTINLFWNRHIIHHSSEEFNLACALRQSISEFFSIYFFLLVPLAALGIPQEVIAVVAPLHLFAQFWYHTRLIDKMGFLEHIIVTPSHHRVHHAINKIYIDKNYSQIFIVWDKWFGTFQQELTEEIPVYGVKKPVQTWNPILINFQHVALLFMDAWRAQKWSDKFKIWFMPTGWRPEDVKKNYPIQVDEAHTQVKYAVPAPLSMKIWSWIQLFFTLAMMIYMLRYIDQFSFLELLVYGFFLMASIYSYTSLMDGYRYAVHISVFILGMTGLIYYWQSGWFQLSLKWPTGNYIIMFYTCLVVAMTIYFQKYTRTWTQAKSPA